jgi:opacity protein-like surface antigen
MNKQAWWMTAALVMAATGASAQSAYLGVAGGVTRHDVDCTGTVSCDKSGSGYKAYLGYHVNPAFSVEALVYDVGTFSGSVNLPGTGLVNAAFKTTGFGLAGVVNLPLGPSAELLARLGAGSNKMKVSLTSGSLVGSDSETKTHLLWGIGMGFKLNPNLSLRAEIDGTAGTYADEKFQATLLSLGLSLRF